MKSMIKKNLQNLLIVPALVLGVALISGIGASVVGAQACDLQGGIAGGAGCAQGKDQQADLFGETGIFKTITNVLLFVIGAVSVIMLIIGGIRYTTSGGDTGAIQTAKNTILYAVVGIVVALLAYALVNFVVTNFANN